jgi:hypothetical protein
MTQFLYDNSIPTFIKFLTNIQNWLEKAIAEGRDEQALMAARLAPDMRPLPAQVQIASDTAKNAVARLTGTTAPKMEDTEATFAELKERCVKTIAYLEGMDRAAFDGAAEREIVLTLPNGSGFRFSGLVYLTDFVMPNFMFHATMTYAVLRSQGVALGKFDFLQHLGPPQANVAD